MKEFTNVIKIENPDLIKNSVYFDIETTGFAPASTNIYLIGCIYEKDGNYYLSQFFAEDVMDEAELITSFFDIIKDYSNLIHYNGSGFDIPYIIKKCDFLGIPCDFNGINSIDIYKAIQPVKSLFKLPNLKQKTIEEFFNIKREDKYSGGELINVYNSYLKKPDNELLDILLCHNREDVYNMTTICPIMNYSCLLEDGFKVESIYDKDSHTTNMLPKKEIYITLKTDKNVPVRTSIGNDKFYFTIYRNTARVCIQAYTDELKYFYPNYNDYYYLPNEDCAIHKSVAFYVDKNFRTKAKAANCYSKKTGVFLPQYSEIITPYFKIDYFDKISYFEYTDEFKSDTTLICKYVNHILKTLL